MLHHKALRVPVLALLLTAGCDPTELPSGTSDGSSTEPVVAAPGVDVPEGFVATEVVVGEGLTRISGMALGPDGMLYVSDIGELAVHGDEGIYRVDPSDGTVSTVVPSGLPLGTPGRLLFGDGRAPFGDDLIVADWNSEETAGCCGGRIFSVDVETGAVATVSLGSPSLTTGDPFGIALASGGFPGAAYVQDFQGASSQEPVLMRIDADGSAHDVLAGPSAWATTQAPRHIVIGQGAGYSGMYILDGAPGRIWHVDADYNLTTFIDGPAIGGTPATGRFGLGDAFGRSLYVLGSASKELKTITPEGTSSVFGTVDDADGFADMVFAPGCGTLYIGTGDRIVAIQALH